MRDPVDKSTYSTGSYDPVSKGSCCHHRLDPCLRRGDTRGMLLAQLDPWHNYARGDPRGCVGSTGPLPSQE